MLNITGHAAKIGRPLNGKHLATFLLERTGGKTAAEGKL
jgi:hypothetical protein